MRPWAHRVLLGLAAILLVVAALGAWAERNLLDTNQFTKTSVEVLQDPRVQDTTAAFLANELTKGGQLQAEIAKALPPRLSGLAGPLSAGAGELAERTAKRLLKSGGFQTLWENTTRRAHAQFINVIEHDSRAGVVLDLRPELGVLAQRLGVTGAATGDKAKVHVLRPNQLDTARSAVNVLRTLRWVSAVLALVLVVAAVAVAPSRARGLLNVGLVFIGAGLLIIIVRRVAGSEIVTALTDNGAGAGSAQATWEIVTSLLRQIAGTGIVLGVLCLAGGWLAGGTKRAASSRRALAPVVVDRPAIAYGAVLTLIVILLAVGWLPAASRPLAVVIYLGLVVAGVAALRRQMSQELA